MQFFNRVITFYKRGNNRYLILIGILILISLIYDYQSIVFKEPQSVHRWRQADCASLALNYYQNGMRFFQPEVHNLTQKGGTSGKACTSEIPVLYYFIAILYRIFGQHDFIYRIINTLLFLTGIFYLFKFFEISIGGYFWPLFFSLIFFTSPVLVYYGNNYLTNSSSLAFEIIAWYHLYNFYKHSKNKDLIYSFIFFLLAGAFKITGMFGFFALFGLFLIELSGIYKFKGNTRLFKNRHIFLFIAVLIPITGWILYARYFNKINNCSYFSTFLWPIWEYNSKEKAEIIDNVVHWWLPQYFNKAVLITLLSFFVLLFFRIKKTDKLLFW